MSIYDAIGGAPAVDAAVDIFYRKVLRDPRISHFFDATDMEAQHAKQKAFLTLVLGGPAAYSGRDLRSAHRGMQLTDVHFDAVASHLVDTLTELEVPAAQIESVVAVVSGARNDVLDR